MIAIYNPSKQTFFKNIVNYLANHEEVILREIKSAFPEKKNLEHSLEEYIDAGYIVRNNRRYSNAFELVTDNDQLAFGQEFFIDTESPVFEDVKKRFIWQDLTNETNAVILREAVDFLQEELTLQGYFYRLKEALPLSPKQQKLYDLLGDVNQAYALKYMTTFLLKFARKERVIQKRKDIFVEALAILGYIEPVDAQSYTLKMELDKERMLFTSCSNA
ncbi:DUF1803 domain-containing protein [Streptococcus sp. X16XC17]|uniref:DUF1803 domain-containing protein n=1 Tax=unclassified Streptococcus TaxID=2608887 RepID=UPI00066FE5DE|nr:MULTISPECIES: DUF1803 domain-containing protein [unclassified Streptococcus]TCD46115.1 DUF1803 domain-containing protein [Streptococcus sp. X16XC17]